ncbi:MAG: PSD1 and planctomycete cytochrome C domain-containing protein [Planctomycetota bacterium]|nr:PSD1 and planctomycete cytochrome C domain-containing protein [Planctomycetota bacterium]
MLNTFSPTCIHRRLMLVLGPLNFGLRLAVFWAMASLFWNPACTLVSADDLDFTRRVRPILSNACYSCHGPDRKAREAELRLDDRTSVLESNVLQSGELLKRITSNDPDEQMPPPSSIRKLSESDRATLVQWVQADAVWPEQDQHWSLGGPRSPEIPAVENPKWPRNGLDFFILNRLEQEGLSPNRQADKATVLRRVTYDVTGFPPTLDELNACLADRSAAAYDKVVSRLLASSRYGEHMALGWMEASRYADTDGYQNDRLRYMWVWRDWLIKTLNENKPFNEFIIEQMAGDLIPNRNFYSQVATGFNRNHRINSEGGSIPDEWIVEYVADRVETMGTLFLGLTLTCSRCHDHKYDPISQKDFYRLFAFFNNVAEAGLGPNNGNSPPFIQVPKSWPNLSVKESEFVIPAAPKVRIQQTSVPRPQPGSPDTVMVMHERKQTRDTYLLRRGQYDQPDRSEKLKPATPPILGTWNPSWPANRFGLAQWLVSPGNPLTSRVTVNRVWQHYFGTGLVKTSENFGLQGEMPSHPQLLDWLATEFVRNQWNLKAFHRLIVTSATYRQASSASLRLLEKDPDNRLLARGPRKRLSPYAIRDSALFTSGLLVEQSGGPSVRPYMPPGIWKSISNAKYKQDHGDKLYRRSLYTYWRRTVPPPNMMAFNAAARETCIVRNDQTTTPLQALTLMNNITFVEAARFLAEKMIRQRGTPRQRIALAFRRATSRIPTQTEIELLVNDFQIYQEDFQKRGQAAKQLLLTGEKPFNTQLDTAELAAYALVANTILNLDEAISQN